MSFAKDFLKRQAKKKARVIELGINPEQFKQHLESFLYASSILNDNDVVLDIEFPRDIIPLKLYLKEIPKKK